MTLSGNRDPYRRRRPCAIPALVLIAAMHALTTTPVKAAGGDPPWLPSTFGPRSDWMGNMEDRLRDLQVNKIVIPGTHDSGTHAVTGDSFFAPDDMAAKVNAMLENDYVKPTNVQLALAMNGLPAIVRNFVAGWSRTQIRTISEQLNDGIRYFDLRATGNVLAGGDAYIAHGMFGESLAAVLARFRAFTLAHPKEVLVIEISHFNAMSVAAHRRLVGEIQTQIGAFLVSREQPDGSLLVHPNLTFGELWDRRQRIFVIYDKDGGAFANEDLLADHPTLTEFNGANEDHSLWPAQALDLTWPEQTTTEDLIHFLALNITSPRNINAPGSTPCGDCPFQGHAAILTETTAILGASATYVELGQYVNPVYQAIGQVVNTVKSCHADTTFPFVHCSIQSAPPPPIPPKPGTVAEWEGPDPVVGQNVGPNVVAYFEGAWATGDSVNDAIGALNIVDLDRYERIVEPFFGLSYVDALIALNRQVAIGSTHTPSPSNPTPDLRIGDRVDFVASLGPLTQSAIDSSYGFLGAFFGPQIYLKWDFGDGAQTCKPTGDFVIGERCNQPKNAATHVYDAPGCYTVKAFLMSFNGPRNEVQQRVCVAPPIGSLHVNPPPAIVVQPTEPGGGARVGSSPALQAFLGLATASDPFDPAPAPLETLAEIADNTFPIGPNTIFPPGVSQVDFRFIDKWGQTGIGFSAVTVVAPPRIVTSGTLRTDAAGGRYIDLILANMGPGVANQVLLNGITFRTMVGSGSVTLSTQTPPIVIGSLQVGASWLLRLNVTVPATVSRFAMTETGTVYDAGGGTAAISSSQAFIR